MTTAAAAAAATPSTAAAIAGEPLRCLLHGLRPQVLGRALITAILCSVCFPALILILAWHSMGLKDLGLLAGMPIAVGLFAAYAIYGLHFGFVVPLLSSLLEQIPDFYESLRPITDAVVRRIFDWMPGQISFELPEFKRRVDDTISACFMTRSEGVLSLPLRLLHRFVLRRSIHAFRDALLHDLVQELRARGQTRVTAELLHTYASKHIASMTAEKLQTRLENFRTIHLDITLLLFAIPLGVAIYRLA